MRVFAPSSFLIVIIFLFFWILLFLLHSLSLLFLLKLIISLFSLLLIFFSFILLDNVVLALVPPPLPPLPCAIPAFLINLHFPSGVAGSKAGTSPPQGKRRAPTRPQTQNTPAGPQRMGETRLIYDFSLTFLASLPYLTSLSYSS